MNTNSLRHRAAIIAVIPALLVTALVGGTSAASPSASPETGEDFDRAFIDMMVPHHQSAVAMATVALARAERPEIAELAPEIIEAQELEIAQLRTWREAWYGDASTPPLTAMPMDTSFFFPTHRPVRAFTGAASTPNGSSASAFGPF